MIEKSRSLHGERGLKFLGPNDSMQAYWSLPSRGAWIEILIYNQCGQPARSLPSRGAWIEICVIKLGSPSKLCRSLHGERGLKYI